MKTITIKSSQNIPVHSSFIIKVDDKKIGLVKVGSTEYFEIQENAKKIVATLQGAKTNAVDISENKHHFLIIDSKKQILNNLIFALSFLALSFGINFYLKLELEYRVMIQIILAFILYALYKKTKFNNLQLSLIEK